MAQVRMTRWAALGALGLGLVWAGGALAQSQPVSGPQDQACRDEATRVVMGQPVPGADPYVRGRQIWEQCMARSRGGSAKAKGKKGKRQRRG